MKFDNKICLGLLEIGDLGPLLLISASRPHSGRKHLNLIMRASSCIVGNKGTMFHAI